MPAVVQSWDANMKIYVQYEDPAARTVDNFEGAHSLTSWQTSTIGRAVMGAGLPATPQEDDLRSLDAHSPHLTAGLTLGWDNVADSLRYDIPAAQRTRLRLSGAQLPRLAACQQGLEFGRSGAGPSRDAHRRRRALARHSRLEAGRDPVSVRPRLRLLHQVGDVHDPAFP